MAEQKYTDLTTFKALSFDCYGTLIDWETGLLSIINLLTSQLPPSDPRSKDPSPVLKRFDDLSMELEQSYPTLLYNENQTQILSNLARELGVSVPDSVTESFGNSPGTWGPFSDTINGLEKLKKRYKLIILSNIDNRNMKSTLENGLAPIEFDAVYTAQDIGSYKPSHQNFHYLFAHARQDLGIDWENGDLAHVGCSLKADHVPAKELGLRSVWISRGADKAGSNGIGTDIEGYKNQIACEWQFDTLGDFADEVERQFAAKEKTGW